MWPRRRCGDLAGSGLAPEILSSRSAASDSMMRTMPSSCSNMWFQGLWCHGVMPMVPRCDANLPGTAPCG